jgi:hypothetical protein
MRLRWGLTVWSTVLLVACSNPPFIELPNPLAGQITDVDEDSFVVTTPSGERFEFINANPEDEGMGQAHMRVHLADRTPVLVTWRRDGYDLVAVKVADGAGPSVNPSPVTSSIPSLPGFPP